MQNGLAVLRGWELVVPRWNVPISFSAIGSRANVRSTRVDDGRSTNNDQHLINT